MDFLLSLIGGKQDNSQLATDSFDEDLTHKNLNLKLAFVKK
jgi:hypothetical protein